MLNRTVLKEFQESNLKSFSDGQININFPNENDLTKVDVVLTPTGGLYKGGTFNFAVNLPSNYPESVASISCRTKIFHPNIDFSGYICFNLLNDEWNPNVRLVDYAHGLLWLLYQPNLGSRLNGAVPNDEREYAEMVRKSLQGKTVAGVAFPPMIPADPETVEDYQLSVAQLVAMFNAPRPPPPPPLGFRMRIPTTTTATPTTTVTATPPTTVAPVVIDPTAPAPPAPPTAEPHTQAVGPAAEVQQAEAEAAAKAEAEADAEAEAEAEEEEEVVVPAPRAGRQVRALRRSSERVAELSRTAAASPRRQRHAGSNQEKQSRSKPSTKTQQRRRGNNSRSSRSSATKKKTQTKMRGSANA